jgi:hypothetical protein
VCGQVLAALADGVLGEMPALRRRKFEQLITELVHKRDATRDVRPSCGGLGVWYSRL